MGEEETARPQDLEIYVGNQSTPQDTTLSMVVSSRQQECHNFHLSKFFRPTFHSYMAHRINRGSALEKEHEISIAVSNSWDAHSRGHSCRRR